MKIIKLMADYECYPLWNDSEGGYGNINPDTLPISESLKNALNNWASDYDRILNLDDPSTSGFKTLDEEIAFKKKGRVLKEELQIELGENYEVIYQP